MSAEAVMDSLAAARFSLRVESGKLLVMPASRLTAEQLTALRRHKKEIIAILCRLPRRVVILGAGEIAEVLEECEAVGHLERCRAHAERHRGAQVCGEWRRGSEWIRFFTCRRGGGNDVAEMS